MPRKKKIAEDSPGTDSATFGLVSSQRNVELSKSVGSETPQRPDTQVIAESLTIIHQGPLPSPETLMKYNGAVPDGADRIIKMAEKEQDHQHLCDREDMRDEKRGMYFAFIIATVCLIGGFVTINLGHPITGSIFAGSGLASVIALFIHGRQTVAAQKKTDQEE